tara:strand:- start:94709 stop:95443 length:735 start_codon:yes stop_codon:yes gene_type:complete
MEKNKTGKYLKYAIGEIALVVIGILIALQINNWNQQRLDRILEEDYYCQFLEDINQDLIQLHEQVKNTQERLHHANKMLGLLQSENSDYAKILEHTKGAVSKTDAIITPNINAFEDLKSSGNLRLITDKKIKNQLTKYYANTQGLLNIINSNAISITTRFKDKTDKINNGWIYLIESQNGFDSTLVSVEKLKKLFVRNKEVTRNHMNDALAYIGSNSRNLEHLKSLESEVLSMKALLETKCIKP